MLNHLVAAGAATALAIQGVTAQQCSAGTASEIHGNWYCSAVDSISYTNFPGTGFYNKVTNMDASTGTCATVKHTYSGSLSPLNEELSIHIRGPTWLKELAVYTPNAAVVKRNEAKPFEHGHGRKHAHTRGSSVDQAHSKLHKLAERAVGDLVTATIDGQIVHWTNEYAGPGAATHAAASVKYSPEDSNASQATNIALDAKVPTSSSVSLSSNAASLPSSKASASASIGGWGRQAYYDAGEGISKGLTFLNHFGQVDSIPAFGASLSYASKDAKSGVASPEILGNAMLNDDAEIVILSDRSCDDGKCGYTRPRGLAYHGFGGDHKIFLLSFTMPFTRNTGFDADMPAIWLMNAQIPLTSQYGTNPSCSCWTSGCGEFDIFEVLDSGNSRCKSTLHMAPAGGSSDYFKRPTDETVKVAIVFAGSNETASIQVLDEIVAFDETLTEAYVQQFISQVKGPSSWFRLVV